MSAIVNQIETYFKHVTTRQKSDLNIATLVTINFMPLANEIKLFNLNLLNRNYASRISAFLRDL